MYAAPVWSTALECNNKRKILEQPMRRVALRVASAYRTVSTQAILVVSGIPPVDLLARERARNHSSRGELDRAAKRKEARAQLMTEWQTRWDAGHTALYGTSASGPDDHTATSTSTWCRCSPDTDASVGICTGSKGGKTRHASTVGTPETMWNMQYLNVIGGTVGGAMWRTGSPWR